MTDQAGDWISPQLVAYESAHVATRGAWLYPEDHEQRALAVEACYNVRLNYLELVANVVQSTGASMGTARRQVAEALRRKADEYYLLCATEPTGDSIPDCIPLTEEEQGDQA